MCSSDLVEVKPGEVHNCDPGDGKYLHLWKVALGQIQSAKESERVLLNVPVDNKKIFLDEFAYEKCDQFSLDIRLSKPFKLSHSCTTQVSHRYVLYPFFKALKPVSLP